MSENSSPSGNHHLEKAGSSDNNHLHNKAKPSKNESSDSDSSQLSNTKSGDSSDSEQSPQKTKDSHRDASCEWRTYQTPNVPPPDDSQIENQLNQYYDITTLFQQMRSVS